MTGQVRSIDASGCRGWARLPDDPHYPVTVHLVLDDVVRASCLADQDCNDDQDPHAKAGGWFSLDVSDDVWKRHGDVQVTIGETGELLDFPALDLAFQKPKTNYGVPASGSSLLSALTYRDGLARGLDASDVCNLLYLDILHRPGDAGGIASQLSDLASGRSTIDSVRKTMLLSAEYQQLVLKKAGAPGRIFSRPLAARSSSRRLNFEKYATAFQRSVAPMPQKLLRFFPGLLLRPEQIVRLEDLVSKGLPDREIFCRALSYLSDQPALILSDLPEPLPEPITTSAGQLGNNLLMLPSSNLFALGWHRTEGSEAASFRWMSQIGVILNPYPQRAITRVEIVVNAWYGALSQAIVIASEKGRMALSHSLCDDGRYLLTITGGESGSMADYVVLVAAEATCPLRYNGSPDPRVLSINVAHALFVYEEEAA